MINFAKLTNRNAQPEGRALSVISILTGTYRVDSILTLLAPFYQYLVIAADSLLRTMSIRAEKAISGKCVSQFTSTMIFAATKEGISKDSIKQFWFLWMRKRLFMLPALKVTRITGLMDSQLGIFSILRVVADRCRTRPELVTY